MLQVNVMNNVKYNVIIKKKVDIIRYIRFNNKNLLFLKKKASLTILNLIYLFIFFKEKIPEASFLGRNIS